MWLDLEHPHLTHLACETCQLYQIDDMQTGLVRRNQAGDPMKRPDPELTPCRTPKGCPKGTPETSKALTPRNYQAYQHYLRCRAVGRFPEDSLVECHAAIIDGVIRDHDRHGQLQLLQSMMVAGR